MSEQPRKPRNTTGVGGAVVRDNELLVVRMTYGPSQGRYMLPGGLLDPGETADVAVAREVREETSIEAVPRGIIGVRCRYTERGTDTYLIWQMDYLSGEPEGDGREIEHARFMTLEEIEQRDDVVYLVSYVAGKVFNGGTDVLEYKTDYEYLMPGATPDSWKLFM
ncbi:MAG: NUDIX domain-containing protein [Sphaerobacteraceae bacterium]|nr:MAG: NUDIX domain-containing protein [Sphaerobacteraceae bacterium]